MTSPFLTHATKGTKKFFGRKVTIHSLMIPTKELLGKFFILSLATEEMWRCVFLFINDRGYASKRSYFSFIHTLICISDPVIIDIINLIISPRPTSIHLQAKCSAFPKVRSILVNFYLI